MAESARITGRFVLQVAVVAVLGAAVIWLVMRQAQENALSQARKGLRAAIDKARSEGVWVEHVKDLIPPYRVEENAAGMYARAYEILNQHKQPNRIVDLADTHERADYSKLLAAQEEAFTLATKASRLPRLVLAGEEDDLQPPAFGDALHGVLEMTRALRQRARVEILDRQIPKALSDLTTIVRISNQLSSGTHALGMLVSVTASGYVAQELEELVSISPSSAKLAKRVLQALAPPGSGLVVLQRALIEYRHHIQHVADKPYRDHKGDPDYKLMDTMMKRAQDPVARLRYETGLVNWLCDYLAAEVKGTRLSEKVRIAEAAENQLKLSTKPEEAFIQWMDPTLSPVFRSLAFEVARRRMCWLALTIVASGSIPKELPLKGEDALDAQSDQPMDYRHTRTSFTISCLDGLGRPYSGNRGMGNVFEFPYYRPRIQVPEEKRRAGRGRAGRTGAKEQIGMKRMTLPPLLRSEGGG